jgi:hypothetical protein
MSLSQLQQPVRHGRGVCGGDAKGRQHGGKVEAAVEAAADLG